MELSSRQQKILAAVVEHYIATGEPAGSKMLCDSLDFTVSPATVRNEMSELAERGLLLQPHTSAGRIPSQKGYRVYVDRLMKRRPLSPEERRTIDRGRRPSGLRKTKYLSNSLAHITTWLRSDLTQPDWQLLGQ